METEEVKKTLLWVECIPSSNERKLETFNTPHTYCVTLKYIEGIKENAAFESYQIQAVLFDQKYCKLFGNFWTGKPSQVKNSLVTFNQQLFFYTFVPAKELLLIIEIIAHSKDKNVPKTSAGWLCLPLIEVEEEVTYRMPFIKGTPIFMLYDEEDAKKTNIKLTEHATGIEISMALSSHPSLLQVSHLLPENILIDSSTEIPGLLPQIEDADDDFVFKPKLQKCITFVLERLCVRMHSSRNIVEKEILQKVQAHLTQVKPDENLLKAQLLQRRLQIAVHNGFCFIQEPDFYHLLVEPLATPTLSKTLRRASSLGSLNVGSEEGLVLRSDVKLPKIPNDPNISIIFLLEYVICLENSEEKQHLLTSVSKSQICNVAIAWGFCQLKTLKENPSQNITLSCDSTFSPHRIKFLKLDQELEISFSSFSLLKQKNPYASLVQGAESNTSSKSDTSFISSNTGFSSQVAKHKSVADIPMSVEQSGNKSSARENTVYRNENNLALQEVTLVSSSLPLIPPLLHSFPLKNGASSEIFSKVYWDKLPPVLDHHGKPAFHIDNSVPYKIDADIELQCSPQKNECMLNFLAISSLGEYVEIPCEVFLTFQFYRFLPIKTESLALKQLTGNEDSSSKPSFVFALHKIREKDKMPGFQVTYNVDPTELNVGEYRSFIHYLMKQTLHIDLWNAQSMLYFGTVMLPLKYFCRQGKEAVCTILELDIVNCEFPDESLSQNSVPLRKPLGKLHVSLASVRYPLSTKALEKFEDVDYNVDSTVIFSKGKNSSSGHSHVVSKARPIVETDKELSKLLSLRYTTNSSQHMVPDPHVTEDRRRKLARMEAVRNLENNNSSFGSGDGLQHYFKEKQRDLLSIESYIQKNKTEIIHSLLYKAVTSEKIIFPVIGNKVFFEFVIENPFPVAKKIEIAWKSPELSLVTDNKLWHVLRNMHNISQKVNSLNFDDISLEKPSLSLQPGEKVNVPFTYQCFSAPPCQLDLFKAASGHHFSSDMLSSAPSIKSVYSSIKIRFMTEERTLLAILNLKIQPLPPSFSHVFKFLSMEHSMFKKTVQINKENNMNEITLYCSDPSTTCSIQENQNSEESIKILVKAPTKSAGKCTEFYVFAYKDKFQISPFQTWSVSVCPLQRIDLSCVAGQLMRSSLLIRGTHSTNLVRCFSSSQDLQLDPSDPFVLSPFAVQELSMNIRSLIPGVKHFQITMVNQSQEQVLQSWLLVLSCQKPSVSKAFQIHLSIGKEAAKRITYTNPYHQSRSFVLYSSHPHLLSLRESQFTVLPGKSYSIGLYFLPHEFVFSETIFLYMNDASDKNEETYCVKVVCL